MKNRWLLVLVCSITLSFSFSNLSCFASETDAFVSTAGVATVGLLFSAPFVAPGILPAFVAHGTAAAIVLMVLADGMSYDSHYTEKTVSSGSTGEPTTSTKLIHDEQQAKSAALKQQILMAKQDARRFLVEGSETVLLQETVDLLKESAREASLAQFSHYSNADWIQEIAFYN